MTTEQGNQFIPMRTHRSARPVGLDDFPGGAPTGEFALRPHPNSTTRKQTLSLPARPVAPRSRSYPTGSASAAMGLTREPIAGHGSWHPRARSSQSPCRSSNAGPEWMGLHMFQQIAAFLVRKYTLYDEQMLAFLAIVNHQGHMLTGSPSQQAVPDYLRPLRISVTGPAGTEKSQIFAAIAEFFNIMNAKKLLKMTTPTGMAAVNIRGCTIHSEAKLRMSKQKLMSTKKTREDLETRWAEASCLLIDEIICQHKHSGYRKQIGEIIFLDNVREVAKYK
ncbi:MAG: hypothetical protein BJ554DRAFT_5921 [Olpidium bornovanus]|uniref:ATP-dependent DNA helicase n=1 Tax=Olpidium bornovanus TaxID=278681 RepID=A0A8H8DKL9_9FUNG|nr:MAG: hypothetical protein BJ554DRAFT_5921 [Olpidium bornovanus]